MNPDFYRAFEDRHRGPRELIKSRLRVYLPFIEPLKTLYADCRAVDLGCGRGEWLELLREIGVDAHGVDLDDGMLAACRELGLRVETGEAGSCLKTLPDESQAIVSGFHIAEHMPFADLQILVQEALRVLKPAGLLILETPNPENIAVGTANFYVDPTHRRPIPMQLLSFLPEHYGFCRTKVLRLQESPELAGNKAPSLLDVLSGVSPDYAIVAQKRASDEQLAEFSPAFEKEYGVSLEALAVRYDARNQEAERQLAAIYTSSSWTLTRPLRWLKRLSIRLTAFSESVVNRFDRLLRRIPMPVLLYFLFQSGRSSLVGRMIDRFPVLRAHLSAYFLKLGVIYYWVDHTCAYPSNSGIQRVVRGLARALLAIGIKVVPVKWDESNHRFYPPTHEELQHLAKWNGPQPDEWGSWVDPLPFSACDWILIPELTTYLTRTNVFDLKRYAATNKLRCAWIFYDAIPWKMHDIYPSEARLPHQHYMEGLSQFERVFAISEHSRADLSGFLATTRVSTPNLDERVLACVLPGEFLEGTRVTKVKARPSTITKILCVGTIEPRKNHLRLLEAFTSVAGQTQKPLELWLAGSGPLPELAERVEHYISTVPGIHWERNADDTRLRELYAECDFTVYPSLEEGFGLPVLESLWNARPCICRNSSALAEVAKGGGCLTTETADASELAKVMLRLIEDDALRLRLAHEATARHFNTWDDYGREIAVRLAAESVG